MAQFPCSACGNRYKGAQQTAYPAVLIGTEAIRTKMRLCPPDFQDLEEWAIEHLQEAVDEEATIATCGICAADQPNVVLFLTLYAAGQDRKDFWGRVCQGCAPQAHLAFFGEKRTVPAV